MGVRIQKPGDPGHPGGNRRVYVRVNHRGHRRTRVFNNIKSAERYAEEVEYLLKHNKSDEVFTSPPPVVTPPTVRTFGDHWASWFALERAGWKPRTVLAYERQFNTHLTTLVDQPLNGITRQALKEFVARKLDQGNLRRAGKGMAANSVKGILVPLRKCLQAAVDDGLIPANPAARVKVPQRKDRTQEDKIERYTREELGHILRTTREQLPTWFPVLLTAARTGLRVGELAALRIEDLDFTRRYIHVRRAISRRIEGTPKNGKARRVDMSAQLASVLANHLKSREIAALVAGKNPTPWVFGSLVTGRYLCDEFLAKQIWPRVLRLAGIRALKFHALRHTFASLLIEQGESLAYVRDQLGHASIQITVDTYGHLIPGANRAAVDRLDDPTGAVANASFCNPRATEATPAP